MISRRELFSEMRKKWQCSTQERRDHLLNYLVRSSEVVRRYSDMDMRGLSNRVSAFCTHVQERWQKSQRKIDTFLKINDDWLNQDANIVLDQSPTAETSGHAGRPKEEFRSLTDSGKRKRTEEMRKTTSLEEMSFAASASLRSSGQRVAAEVLDEALRTPTRATKIQKAWVTTQDERSKVTPFSEDEALALFVDAKLTKGQYLIIRKALKTKGAEVLPSYDRLLLAKERCYPARDCFDIQDTHAEIKLQPLLDHTVDRLLSVQEPVLKRLSPEQLSKLTLISKWGFDGASGQSSYKQHVPYPDFDDRSIFFTSIVPLQLFCNIESAMSSPEKIVVWQNPRTSSTRVCRPIKLEFIKESNAAILKEKENMQQQIKNLRPSKLSTLNYECNVTHDLHLTMIDGKACNAVTANSSSQTCNVCKAKPSEMNNLDKIAEKEVNEDAYQYGLSTLHCWIRTFECLLHISYKLDVKKWRVTTDQNKNNVAERKLRIQREFREKLGLTVDQPKQGSGTSNDGNLARRFFQSSALSSEITGVDENLIIRLSNILHAISSSYELDVPTLRKYSHETAKLYVSLYGWYEMPASLHKLLIHGADITETFPLPIGQFSEESQESRHKDVKKYREFNTHVLLFSSDPLISTLRRLPQRKISTFSPEVLQLLRPPLKTLTIERLEIDDDNDCDDF